MRQFRYIKYEYTPPGIEKFQNVIARAIDNLIAETQPPTFTDDRVSATPIWGAPVSSSQYRANIFVLMPFEDKMYPVFDEHLRKVADNQSRTIKRGDDFYSTYSVVRDIWSAIHLADLIIADCANRNPNVFYELGIAHTLGKPTIMITQNPRDIPFDLQHYRFIPYEYTPPGMTRLEQELADAIVRVML